MSSPIKTNLHKLKKAAAESPSIDSTLYGQMIRFLMYLVNTRPDICYIVNALSQFMCEPKEIHLVAVKHIMRYKALLILGSSMRKLTWTYMGTQTEIGLEVLLIGKTLLDVVSV